MALHTTLRAFRALSCAVVFAVVGVLLSAVPSHADISYEGDLTVRGPGGSALTDSWLMTQSGAPGKVLTYTVNVKNTGSTQAQFKVTLSGAYSGAPKMYKGSLALQVAGGPEGYYTAPLNPGASEVLTVKVTLPAYQYADYYGKLFHYVGLQATNGSYIDQVGLESTFSRGVSALSATASANGQPAVGGYYDYQTMTAPTVSATGSAAFAVVVKNNGTSPVYPAVRFDFGDCLSGWTPKVTFGGVDKTNIVMGGGDISFSVAPGASKTINVTMKSTQASCSNSTTVWTSDASVGTRVVQLRSNPAAVAASVF